MEHRTYTFNEINTLLDSGDTIKLVEICSAIHPADISSILYLLSSKKKVLLLKVLRDIIPHEALSWFDHNIKLLVIDVLGADKMSELLNKLDIEDLINFIDELDDNTKENIVSKFDDSKRQLIYSRLEYEDDSIGRIMEKYCIVLPEHWTVKHAISYFKRYNDKKKLYYAVVVNKEHEPLGYILISDLLRHQLTDPVVSVIIGPQAIVHAHDHTNKAVHYFKQYNMPVIPVVNLQHKLIGTVSVSQMSYLITEEVEGDMMQLSGINLSPAINRLLSVVQVRFPCLFINLTTACIISNIIGEFSDVIDAIPFAAAMMPIAASMGGNAASQTMTITVRELSKNHIGKHNFLSMVLREMLTTSINGLLLATISVFTCLSIVGSVKFSMVFGLGVMINFVVAGLVGSLIPIMLQFSNLDPAPASSILVTACTDSVGFFSFLCLVHLFLV